MVGVLNLATASNGAHRHNKSTIVDPPNGLYATHVPTALPAAAVVTKLPDDVSMSIGWTYCIGTAEERPICGYGYCRLQPHCRRQHVVHKIVKLTVISIVFSSFNNVDLFHSMPADCCMPRRWGWGTMTAVGRRRLPWLASACILPSFS